MFNKKLGKREIKESLDNLPTGIIFAKENGVILLANKKMYDLYFKLSGKVLQNLHSFLADLNTQIPNIVFIDNQVYNFNLKKVFLNNKIYIQLTANNITEFHNLQTELIRKTDDLIATRSKLLDTKKTLKKVIFENELIRAKMKVHDTMGTNIATIRHYLNTGTGDIKKALAIWDDSFNILQNDNLLKENNEFDSFINGANDMGITINLTGKPPQDKKLLKTIINISKECLINAVVHSNANEIFLDIIDNQKDYVVKISNNAKKQKKEIKAGGGFMAIKNYLSKVGGKFEVTFKDRFLVRIILPK